ncbi:VOC family protein [Noviherbaspirillum sedimenti]|uniref:VOC family protein n=1 Tax=Noviherbaspirillum sedimenti TaxID=2320865 RepID=A0A3A3GQ91_9BURK|nr:VOC family protein [Noviherbaspirillum sedimenti]RJG03150.1 VOC family protein [Noviherbaspirillum sedimenti]
MSQVENTKRPWGPIMQIAYVVDDLDAAIDYWTGVMGVGPFFLIERPVFENGYYENAPQVMNMTAAMAFSGGLQVELILQHDDTPSIFTQRRPKDNGVHHLAALTEDIDAAVDYLEARGGRRLQGADVGGGRIAYVDTGTPAGILELAQLAPEVLQLFDVIRAAGAAWDGQQRIMTL